MILRKMDTRSVLSMLWIFVTVNFIYCDIFTLHYAPELQQLLTGKFGSIELSQEFLLTFAFILELPMIMIVLSKIFVYKVSRILNIAVALFMTIEHSATLAMGGNTLHYIFFSIIEISTTIAIFVIALKWKPEIKD